MNDTHLLLPLASSFLFVIGAMFAKRAAGRGASPYTTTALSNVCLALVWAGVAAVRQEGLPAVAWLPAVGIALSFVAGQLFTYLAFQLGDVSLATPVFGVKIIMVALLTSLLANEGLDARIWIAASLATAGVGVIQAGTRSSQSEKRTVRQATLSIVLALLAAASLSLFDIGLQHYGRAYGAERFMATMFVLVGLLSLGLLPWTDRPAALRRMNAVWPLALAALFMVLQANGISYALGRFGDATRVNIIYSLRGLWSVLLAWLLSRIVVSLEDQHDKRTLLFRFAGTVLLTLSVLVALL